jgi:hypothetical protein
LIFRKYNPLSKKEIEISDSVSCNPKVDINCPFKEKISSFGVSFK